MSAEIQTDPWSPANNPYAIALSESQWAIWTLDLCIRRIQSGHDPDRQIDARHFVSTLRQLLYAAEMELEAMRVEVPATAVAAYEVEIERYKSQIPGLVEIRNVLTHFADYAVGKGALQRSEITNGTSPADVARKFWGGGYDPATGIYSFGVYGIHIESAFEAALALRASIYKAAKTIDYVREQRTSSSSNPVANADGSNDG